MPEPASGIELSLSDLALRATPPRPQRHLLSRPRLSITRGALAEHAVVVVHAPPGFGKSSLLTQWRLELLGQGAAVAWVSAERGANARRLLSSMSLAVRISCARPHFGAAFLDTGALLAGDAEAATAWLAEVAGSALHLVLMVDEVANLGSGATTTLAYLMHNAPPNLRIVAASRLAFEAELADLIGYGACASVGIDQLRFEMEETIALCRERLGARLDADTCARLHAIVDGWPLGLQLALGAIERGADARAIVDAGSRLGQGQRIALVEQLCATLSADDAAFLARIAHVEMLHARLCQALFEREGAAEQLERLIVETPFFVVVGNGWSRFNTLALQLFLDRFEQLPVTEQALLHERAMRWLVREGRAEQAALHARAAGLHARAFELAEQCFYDAVVQGRRDAVLDWFEHLQPQELAGHPRLRQAAAWALALSERHAEAIALVGEALAEAGNDQELRYECALILSGEAFFADEPDRYLEIMQPWLDAPPPTREARLLQMHANRQAIADIVQGRPAQARRHQPGAPAGRFGPGQVYALRWSELIAGLSYVWAGQMRLAEPQLRASLERVDAELGRRHPLACMFAALLATTLYEMDRLDEAATALANRLDVIERSAFPDTLLFAYRTSARIAAAQGDEPRALDTLETLEAMGEARHLPRISLAAIAEQIRLHGARGHLETCGALEQRMDAILARSDLPAGPIWQRSAAVITLAAKAQTALAQRQWGRAGTLLAQAQQLTGELSMGRLQIVGRAMRAYVLEQSGGDGEPLLAEALGLAETCGIRRSMVDSHPGVATMLQRRGSSPAPSAFAVPARPAAPPRAVSTNVLTPKEREILELLARNLSNKEIGRALGVGEATVKWHLKNLFGKLNAGTRRQVVVRAQVLGFLVAAAP